jgi:hypothetical protein
MDVLGFTVYSYPLSSCPSLCENGMIEIGPNLQALLEFIIVMGVMAFALWGFYKLMVHGT